MIVFTPKGDSVEAFTATSTASSRPWTACRTAHPDLVVAEAGTSTDKALEDLFNSQLARAGLIAIPLTLLILLLVTGSGAIVPVLLGLTSVLATMGLVSLPSLIVPMDEQIAEVILLVGLAVGVDYSIFYMRRERDERGPGRCAGAALDVAAATSGRAVLISGITVMIAMAGMFFSGDRCSCRFAIGTMMVVGVAMIGSLTVLPARPVGARRQGAPHGRIPFLRRRLARRRPARAPPVGRRPAARSCATRSSRRSSPPACSLVDGAPRAAASTRRRAASSAMPATTCPS